MPVADQRSNADAVSLASHASFASEVSIDPVVRRKAEKILDYNANRLEVINEERQTPRDYADNPRLTAGKLKAFEDKEQEDANDQLPKSFTEPTAKEAAANNMGSTHRERATKMSKFSRFEEKSLDQDDSYGNYKPKFQTKNYKVTGRTREVMKL